VEPEETREAVTRSAGRLAFLRGLADNPVLTGAIAPSGPALSRLMASFADPDDPLPVLELGPGTGVVTAALIKRGVAPETIVAVEYSPAFCDLLRDRFPRLTVIRGDAYDLAATLPAERSGPFSAVISSLPLMTRPPRVRRAFVEQALERTAPGGRLIQFSYSLLPPVRSVPGRFRATRSRWVMMNLPPARVWVYRRSA
jgi:phosphatidylethanolamine/phosphatidyl-N-methylethanolamine N-methyltransferase